MYCKRECKRNVLVRHVHKKQVCESDMNACASVPATECQPQHAIKHVWKHIAVSDKESATACNQACFGAYCSARASSIQRFQRW